MRCAVVVEPEKAVIETMELIYCNARSGSFSGFLSAFLEMVVMRARKASAGRLLFSLIHNLHFPLPSNYSSFGFLVKCHVYWAGASTARDMGVTTALFLPSFK